MKVTCFQLKWLIYAEILNHFPLFSLYASNNLVHILLQLGTFHEHYIHVSPKNQEDFLLTLYEVYNETDVRITAD